MYKFKNAGKDIKIFEYAKILKPEVIDINDFLSIRYNYENSKR